MGVNLLKLGFLNPGNVKKFLQPSYYCCTSQVKHCSTNSSANKNSSSGVLQNKIKVNDVDINYGSIGKGSHHILCMPGIYGTIETDFEPLMLSMDHSKFTAICWDPPGYGKSRPPARKIQGNPYANDADAAAQLMQNLGINKYSVLGWSNGGTTGAHLVAMHPKVIDKFVLWGSAAYINEISVKLSTMMLNPNNWLPDRWKLYQEIYGDAEIRRMCQDTYNFISKCHQTGSFRMELLLGAIQAPTLILYGKRDPLCLIQHPMKYKELVRNSILEIWPEGEHDIHLKFQSQFISRVEKFLLTGK